MIRYISAKCTMNTEFQVKFQTNFHVSAAILDRWAGLKPTFVGYLSDNSYIDKVSKAFPQLPIGCDAAAKRSAWG
jgi:hypothetical protein